MSELETSLLQGLDEALEYASGLDNGSKKHEISIPKDVDVLRLRESLHMTREKFSRVFGFPLRTLEKWEQGSRRPTGATRAYLCVIEKNPVAVKEALEEIDLECDDHVLI